MKGRLVRLPLCHTRCHRTDHLLALLPRDLRDDATCTTHHRSSTSFEAKLENPNPTCFQVKQVARSRRVSRAVLLPSVLWRNWQTVARLILRSKPRNCRGNFGAQMTKPNRSCRFWGPNWETRRHWFWGLTKKPALLVCLCMVHTAHDVTRHSNRPTTEYLTCAWPSLILCTRSPTPAMILIAARHIAPVTYTPWDKQTQISIRTDRGKTTEISRIRIQTTTSQ
jgi:hypothetical protein